MPTQETYEESYWTVCYAFGFLPYPCKKKRTVTKWCYQFETLKQTGLGAACQYEGCEQGILYSWWTFCFNIFGTEYFANVKKCFEDKKAESGSC